MSSYEKIFKNNLTKSLIDKLGNDWSCAFEKIIVNVELTFDELGTLELLVFRKELGNDINNWIKLFGVKHASVIYSVFNELEYFHKNASNNTYLKFY